MSMQLYGSTTSPYVRHIRVVLRDTQQDFTLVATDYTQSAVQSPAQRVPFLRDGELLLTDSLSILRHVRSKVGEAFIPDIRCLDMYCLANTVLDATINVFLLERSGVPATQNDYLLRQTARIHSGLAALNAFFASAEGSAFGWDDLTIRVACLVDWVQFRERVDVSGYASLLALLDYANTHDSFTSTHPSM